MQHPYKTDLLASTVFGDPKNGLCSFMFPLVGVVGSGGAPAAVSYASNAEDDVNRTTYTFSSLSLGAGTKKIVAVTGGGVGSGITVSSVTVDGNSCTALTAQANGEAICQLWYVDGVSATTGDVVVTFSSGKGYCGVTVWSASSTATGTASAQGASTASPLTDTITIPENGIAVGVAVEQSTSITHTWTNLTEHHDADIGVDGHHTAASADFSTGGSTAITATQSGGTSPAFVCAAWGPS